ncbi:MAG: transaldolase [Anaerolineales bacterium]
MSTPIRLFKLGQSIWYDNIQRKLLENGELAAMIERGDIRGVTSNPSIFHNAIAKSSDYDESLRALAKVGHTAEEIYERLAVEDIRAATDLFRPLYDETNGGDGYVSLEVSPYLAYDTDATFSEAKRLWELVDRPNLMVKIPATKDGLPAITGAIAAGVNINVTLIFSQTRYVEVIDAYMGGLEKRLEAGNSIDHVASVASFFVSRIDTKVDHLLDAIVDNETRTTPLAKALQGRLAVANAKLAYKKFEEITGGERFTRLQMKGGRVQRPLWASTSTKNPAYSDVKYVDELLGPKTVNTIPPPTLEAFKDHGVVRLTLESGLAKAGQAFEELRALGISFQQVTDELETEGVKSFANALTALLETIEERRKNVSK